jgi:hypothetical protein
MSVMSALQIWNDEFVQSWQNRKVKGLCEDNASSKVELFLSFENEFILLSFLFSFFFRCRRFIALIHC